MDPQAAPLLIDQPRSAAQIAAALQRLLARDFGSGLDDPLRSALVHIAARDGEILTECLNAAPALHLQAFSAFLAGTPRPAAAAHVHLAFKAAPGVARVVVPMHTRITAAPADGDTEPVIFETRDDLELVRADCLQAWFVDAGHRHLANAGALLLPAGRSSDADPFAAAPEVVYAWHIAQREAFGVAGLQELRLRIGIEAADAGTSTWRVDWGFESPKGFVPLELLADTTEQLAHEGEVQLRAPAESWPATLLGGVESRWLTARLHPVSNGLGPADPAAVPLRSPRVRSVALHVRAATPPQPVLAACHDAVALDISKDFFPLGERPRFGEVLHLLSPAFAQPGAHIELRVQMTNPHDATNSPITPVRRGGAPVIAWEIHTADGYKTLAAADGTRSLTEDGTLTFTVPHDVAPTTIAGQRGVWLRARLAAGHYGSSPASDGSPIPIPIAPAIHALLLQSSLELGPRPPEHMLHGGALARLPLATVAGQPFDIAMTPDVAGPTLYLALGNPGAPFPSELVHERVLSLHVQPARPATPIVLENRRTAGPVPRWQLHAAGAWHDLETRDTSNGLTRSGIVRLTLGRAATPWAGNLLDAPAQQCAWLRVGWPAAADPAQVLPLAVALNGVPATHTQRLRDEVLGSSNGQPGQVFSSLRKPIIGNVQLQVREAEDRWLAWQEVADLSASPADARDFVLDRSRGEMRFGDGRQGRIPPSGANNIRLHEYLIGGGRQGNRPALAIAQLRSALPAVETVRNPEAAVGGLDAESEPELRAQASAWLRHRDRAICADDFADLARKASPEVARAFCVAGRDLGAAPSTTRSTEIEAGVVSVVVLPRSSAAQPQPGLDLLEIVRGYLDARRAPVGRLVLTGPTYAAVSVKLSISVQPGESPHTVAETCRQAITRFLHPLTGDDDGKGWPLGKRPHRSDLFALAGAIEGVDVVRSVKLQIDAPAEHPFIVAAGTIEVVAIDRVRVP